MSTDGTSYPFDSLKNRLDGVQMLAAPAVVHELVEALGAQLVAAIAGVRHTATVRSWERGIDPPKRLRVLIAALKATRAIELTASALTARVWFVSENSWLGKSPLEIARLNSSESSVKLVQAAVGFSLQ